MRPTPSASSSWAVTMPRSERGLTLFAGFKHRFNDGRDLCALLLAARTMVDEADTIGEFFLGCHDAEIGAGTDAVCRVQAPLQRRPRPLRASPCGAHHGR